MCVCACVRACVRACERACVRACVCVFLCVYPSDGIHVVACGPIGTKFGTHIMQINLQIVVS